MSNGVYVAVKYGSSNDLVLSRLLEKVPNPIPREEIHTTIIYSTIYDDVVVEKYEAIVRPREYTIWNTKDGKRALVALLDDDMLKYRHDYLMTTYNLNYGYPEYIPHITLSYDIGDENLDLSTLPTNSYLVASNEYKEDLIINWQKSLDK